MRNYLHFLLTEVLPLFLWMAGLGLLFVGWVALLHFPGDWVVPAVAIFEAIAIGVVLLFERSARSVAGASGWMTFGFFMGHAWLFFGALVLRVLVLIVQFFL